MAVQIQTLIYILVVTLTFTQSATNVNRFFTGKITGQNQVCTQKEACERLIGNGSDCVNHQCVCLNKEGCFIDYQNTTRISNLGDDCTEDGNCNVESAICLHSKCACFEGFVPAGNKRECLKVSGGLGQQCMETIQCEAKVKNSVCSKYNQCTCAENYHRAKFACLLNTPLGSPCISVDDCSHIPFSTCLKNSSICLCLEGYVPSLLNKIQCLRLATSENRECEDDIQCKLLYGFAGICYRKKCSCDRLHHYINVSARCPSNLNQACASDEDCTHFENDESIECRSDTCKCTDSYYEDNGYCNNVFLNVPFKLVTFFLIEFVLLHFNMLF